MNLCGKPLNKILYLGCFVVLFILVTRGKTTKVLYLYHSSCLAYSTFGDNVSCRT